jgi:hypothetical protein
MLPVRATVDPSPELRHDVGVKLWMVLWPILGAVSACVIWVARANAQGRLGRDRSIGIRTAATMSSDQAWIAAHIEAEPWISWAGLAGLVGALVLLFLRTRDTLSVVLVAAGATAVMVAGVVTGWIKGVRKARELPAPDIRT